MVIIQVPTPGGNQFCLAKCAGSETRTLPDCGRVATLIGTRPVLKKVIWVGRARLELATLAGPAPKAGAYTNSAICPKPREQANRTICESGGELGLDS